VISQRYPDVEHLIVESGSTDDSSSVLRRYQSYDHIAVIDDVPPQGQGHALNVGFRAATGDVIGWLNADDRYCSGAFEAAAEALASGEGDLVFGDCEIIDEEGTVVDFYAARAYDQREQLNGINGSIAQPTVFFRRSLLDRVGYLDETLHYVMDYDFWLRASKATTFVRVEKTLAQFRHHADSKTVSQWSRFFPEARAVARRHGGPFFSTALRHRYLSVQWLRNWRRRLTSGQ